MEVTKFISNIAKNHFVLITIVFIIIALILSYIGVSESALNWYWLGVLICYNFIYIWFEHEKEKQPLTYIVRKQPIHLIMTGFIIIGLILSYTGISESALNYYWIGVIICHNFLHIWFEHKKEKQPPT